MAHSKNPEAQTRKSRREKLEAIIRDRLGLGEEWIGITGRPSFFGKIEKSRLGAFENAFGQMVRSGCKWEVLLACLTSYHTYNARERVVRPAQYDSDGELSHLAEKVWEPVGRPPDRDKRNSIDANLRAAARPVAEYEDILSALGRLNPPPTIAASDPNTDGDTMLALHVSADEAVLYLQKLLKWCRTLLEDDSIGNFSTVVSVGQLGPCVYVEGGAPQAKPERRRRLPLKPVADLLIAMSPDAVHTQDQLREALSRFQRTYPRVHWALRAKIDDLHRASNEPADGWRPLFAAEARRRAR